MSPKKKTGNGNGHAPIPPPLPNRNELRKELIDACMLYKAVHGLITSRELPSIALTSFLPNEARTVDDALKMAKLDMLEAMYAFASAGG